MSMFSSNNNNAPSSSPSFSNINLFGCTSRIQQTSNSSVPQLFGTTTSSALLPAPPFGGSSTYFGGTSAFTAAKNVTADQTQNISQGSSTFPTFGKKYEVNSVANEPLLWSKDANVSDSSVFGSLTAPAFGVSSNSYFGTPRFDSYSFGQPAVSMSGSKGTSAFTAAKNVTADQTQNISPGLSTLPTFGKKYDANSVANAPLLWSRDANASDSDSSVFGSLKAPAFGVSSNSHFGTPRFDSYSFGQPAVYMSGSKGKESTTPLLGSSVFGRSTFGINRKGSRTASYTATPEKDSTKRGGEKIQSICGMQTYKDKSQEELRFEDYQLGDKGQKCASSIGVPGTKGFGVIDNSRPFTSPAFNQSTVDQPFHSHFPSTFAMERAAVDSLSNENSTETSSTPFPKSQQFISHIFPPKTSLLRTCGSGSRVESTASDVSFSPWILARPFAPLKPASSSSTTSTFSPLRNPWVLSTSSTPSVTQSPLSPCSVSPSTYPLLAKPSAHDFDQKISLFTTPVLTTGGAPQSTFCLNCLKQSQPTPPGLCSVSNTQSIGLENSRASSQISTGYPLAASQNIPMSFGSLQSEMTPNSGATFPTTIASHPSTGASCSEIGQGIGQPSINGQQSYFPRIMEVKPSPVMSPAETQPSSIQISVEHLNLTTSIQYGISSLPVSNNPAPVRQKSSLIIRHSSLSRHRLPPQKYKPSNDKPKVPFFMDKQNTCGVLRTEVIINPRENPRDWIRPAATKEFSLGADSCTSQLKNTSTDSMHDGDKVGDKPKLEPEEMHYDNCGQLKHCGDDKDVDAIMPKLQRADYYTIPPIEELISKEKEAAGFCCRVKDLVVGRHGYGSIKFLGETDVRKLDLDSVVHFNRREVIIYMDESKKPPVGQGLNKPAEITLLNVRCINKSTGKEYKNGPVINKYRDMLIKKGVEQDAEFISYDPVEGEWKFRVSHF